MKVQALGKHRYLTTTSVEIRSEADGWILPGAMMGIAAGGVFLIFEMIAAGLMGQSAFEPFRLIAAVILGEGALPAHSTIGLPAVVPVALAIHYALSTFYGAVFGAAVGAIGTLRSGMWRWWGPRASSVSSCGWPISAPSHRRCFLGSWWPIPRCSS